MNIVDFAVIVAVLVTALRGSYRGLVKEVFGVAGWLGGCLLAAATFADLGPKAANFIGTPIVFGRWVAFGGVFLFIYTACRFLGWALTRLVRAIFLGPLNNFGGLLFGGTKGLVVTALVLFVFTNTRNYPGIKSRIDVSATGPILVQWVDAAVDSVRKAPAQPEPKAPTSSSQGSPPSAANRPREK